MQTRDFCCQILVIFPFEMCVGRFICFQCLYCKLGGGGGNILHVTTEN